MQDQVNQIQSDVNDLKSQLDSMSKSSDVPNDFQDALSERTNQITTKKFTLSMGTISAGGTSSKTVVFQGALVGDAVVLSLPSDSASYDNLFYKVWVASANSVTIKAKNFEASSSVTPAANSVFVVTLIKNK